MILIQMIPLNCTRLISGGAEGVDQLARQAAETLGIPLTEYLPDYETYGRRASLVRNSQIIAEADLVLAFWDMSSHGTAHTITEMHPPSDSRKSHRLKTASFLSAFSRTRFYYIRISAASVWQIFVH